MAEDIIPPDREKGASPPDYMPSIFGWMSFEDMEEHAKEIANFTGKLRSIKKDNNKEADKE